MSLAAFRSVKARALPAMNPAPVFFIFLSVTAFFFSELSFLFVVNEVITRIIRDSFLVFALIIPVAAGMGLNFSVIVGAMAAQAGWIFMLDHKVAGVPGIAGAAAAGIFISVVCGYAIGRYLNRVRGREMISTIIIGILGAGIYQFIFLVCNNYRI